MFHRPQSKFNIQDWILPGTILGFAVVFGFLGSSFQVKVSHDETEVSYEMARPSTMTSVFSMGGMEIRREVNNPHAPENNSNFTLTGDTRVNPAAAQKAPANAKNSTVAANKKKAAKNTKKKSKVTMSVVEAKGRSLKDSVSPTNSSENLDNSMPFIPQVGGTPQDVIGKTEKKEDKKTSASQLRSLILGQPTSANASVVIRAYNAGDIAEAEFNDIVGQLILSPEAAKQKIAIQMISNVPSVKGFEMLVVNRPKLSKENQTLATQVIASFESPLRFEILNKVFYSSQASVVTEAAKVLSNVIQKYQSGAKAPNDPRTDRGGVRTASVSDFASFVPALQQVIARGGDAALAASVQALLETIQKFNRV